MGSQVGDGMTGREGEIQVIPGQNTGMTQIAKPYLYRNPHQKTITLNFDLTIENRAALDQTKLKSCSWNRRMFFRYRGWDLFQGCKGAAVDILKTLPCVNAQPNGQAPFITINYFNNKLKITGTHKTTKVVQQATTTEETEAVIAPILILSERCPVEITNTILNKEIENWTEAWDIAKYNEARHKLNISGAKSGDVLDYGSQACCNRMERIGAVASSSVWKSLFELKVLNVAAGSTKKFVRAFPYNTMYGHKDKFLKVETLPTGYESRTVKDGVINTAWKQNRVQVYNSSDSIPLMSMAILPNEDATGGMLAGKIIYTTLSQISFSITYDAADTTHDTTSYSSNLTAREPYYIPSTSETFTPTEIAYIQANLTNVEPELYT